MNFSGQRFGRGLISQGILLFILLVFAYPSVFLEAETLIPGDTLFQINPWKAHKELPDGARDNRLTLDSITAMNTYYVVAARAIRHGEWPLWNNLEFCGMPLLANCQSAVLYPPRLLHALFELPVATTLYILLKLWLCGMAAFICARGMNLSDAASRFASVGWMLCAYNVIWAYWPLPDVSVWAPVTVLGIEHILRGSYRRGFYILSAGAAMSLLAGHPETAFVFGAGGGTYFVLRLFTERRRGHRLWKPLIVAGAAWLVALLMTAVQIVPFLEYVANTPAHERSLVPSPSTIVNFWLPRFFGVEALGNFWGQWNSNITIMVYPGIAVWLAVGLLVKTIPKQGPVRARILSLLISSAIFGLVAFDVPLFGLVKHVPPFDKLYLYYCLAWVVFGLIFLAAMGIDLWFAQRRHWYDARALMLPILVAVPVVSGFYLYYGSFLRNTRVIDLVSQDIIIAAMVTGVASGVFMLCARGRRAPLAVGVLTVLLSVDLLLATRDVRPTCPPQSLFIRTDLTDYLASREPLTRVDGAFGLLPAGILPHYGIEEYRAYDGLYPERMWLFQHRLGPRVWNSMAPVCAVNYYLHNTLLDAPLFPRDEKGYFEKVATLDGIEVYENKAAFPRAFLVPRARVVPSEDDMFAIMASNDFDPAQDVLLEEPPPGPLSQEISTAPLGTATVIDRSFTRETVKVQAWRPCMLVLSETYFPGWTATVNGQATKILPAYHAFRAVYLPAGEHTVAFSYKPVSFSIGIIVSIITIVAYLTNLFFKPRAA